MFELARNSIPKLIKKLQIATVEKKVELYKFILDKTVYIGDDLRDAKAAYSAKTKFLYEGDKKLKKSTLLFLKNTLINFCKNV